MKIQILRSLMVAFGLGFGGAAMAVEATSSGAVYANEKADGTVELSNISATDNQEPVVAAPDPAVASTTDAEAAAAEPTKDPREQYRDRMLQTPEVATPATTNASRRYKMMDLATYRATVLGNTAPTPQGGASAPR